jgi:hypothetical protein
LFDRGIDARKLFKNMAWRLNFLVEKGTLEIEDRWAKKLMVNSARINNVYG